MIQAVSSGTPLYRRRRGLQVSGAGGAGTITRYRDAVAADTPVAYYHLAEPSGTSAADSAGAFTGTYVNTPTLGATSAVSDTGDKAVTFAAASTQRVDAAIPTAVTDNWTLECWCKLPSLTTQLALFATNGGDRTTPVGWAIGIGGDSSNQGVAGLNLTGLLPGVSWTPTNYTFADTNWHHVAMVRAAGTILMYADGVAVSVTVGSGNVPLAPATSFLIGADKNLDAGFQRYFNGSLDEVAVYTTPLSAARIAAHYAAR